MQAIYSEGVLVLGKNERPLSYEKFPFFKQTFFAIKPTKGSARLMHQFTSSSASHMGNATVSPLYHTTNFQGGTFPELN